jgi:SAM-dependent methyltransferase
MIRCMDPQTMWGSGNYAAVADKISAVGEHVVDATAVEPGMEVLDVACGAGNATIPAARVGARVTGVDFSPDLLAIARERAADAMVEINWVEADVEQLPFEDASFDRVISTFGHMFAPDHERTAAEMRRVCRDGVIGVCCWTPDGAIGRMFGMVAQLVPPPPGGASPLLWGTEEHVRELLGANAEFERRGVEWRDPSVESYADFMLTSFGPLLNAQEVLGERAGELRDAYIAYLEQENLENEGTLRFRGEYLFAVIRP